jgi:cysteine desulfurase
MNASPNPDPIYLDHHATTPIAPAVLDAMMPFFTTHFGNPGSVGHPYGWTAEAGVKQARERLAQAIGATPEEIIFTSGATEANNLAIKGVAEAYFSQGKHLITVATEHNAVLAPCRYLETLGFDVTILPVQSDGLLDLTTLAAAIRSDTILVSVMVANNEIGTIQPIAEIGQLCHDRGILFHTDAAQAIGKLPLDVQAMNIDLMSLTAHKVYGPKGIGALYVRRRNPRVKLSAQLHGGGQERNLRSGTLNPPLIVGFAKAVELALATREPETPRLTTLRDRLLSILQTELGTDRIVIHGSLTHRLPGNLNLSIRGINNTALLLALRDTIALSSGSACTSGNTKPSHVLKALGVPDELAFGALRFGLGQGNTEADIDRAARAIVATIHHLVGPNS